MLRKICNALLESILKITVGEYTYGLPRFLVVGIVGHGIQAIRCRMLKRMDSFILSRDNLWNSFGHNHISMVSFKLYYMYENKFELDHVSIILCIIYRIHNKINFIQLDYKKNI